MKRKILLLTLAIPVFLCQEVVAQTSSRLVAESQWTNNGVSFMPVDSSSFTYLSTVRGGDLTHTQKYDYAYSWTYNDTAYNNSYYYVQAFDANNNITSMITQYWTGTAWANLSNTIYTYNSSNQKTTMIQQSWNGTAWAPVSQDIYIYNTGGFLSNDLNQQWSSVTTSWVNATQKTYYYDVANNKINETDQNYVAGSPIYTNQWAYTYSTTNQLLTTTYNTWNGSGWSPNTLATDSYDTSGDLITMETQNYNTTTSAWVNNTLDLYSSFTSAHMPAIDVHQTWSSAGAGMWVNAYEGMYTYNSYNQMTSSTNQSWNIVGIFEYALGDPMANYYYATYSPSVTAVKNVSNNAGDAKVYPVPAQSTLNVDLSWNAPQTATIILYNEQGAVVKQWSTPEATQYHSSVNVDNLAQGVYFLNITGTQGQIVKQIVVAH